jgi:hypothetical protein
MEIDVEQLKNKYQSILSKADLIGKKTELKTLEAQSYEASFWTDPKKAGEVMKKIAELKKEIEDLEMMELLLSVNQFEDAKKLMDKYNAFTFVKWIYTFGFLMVLPFGWNEFQAIDFGHLPTDIFWKIGFVVVFSTFLTYLLNLISMRELKPTTVAVFIYLQPLFATIFAVSLGKDDLSVVKLISAVLIFVGVYLVTQKKVTSNK